jgi:murein DD-endopeptidase MepM/ murein hydrolase activator NlpD
MKRIAAVALCASMSAACGSSFDVWSNASPDEPVSQTVDAEEFFDETEMAVADEPVLNAPVDSTTTTTLVTAATTTSTTMTPTTTTTVPPAPEYVFPFAGREVSYPRDHHTYPAVDVFGCGALVLAPTGGVINQTRTEDLWNPATNNPAHRGGLYVSMIGDDGVRYYFSHFETIDVELGQRVSPGDLLGVMGQTGNARNSVCHTHFGISRVCPETEWQVRRGEIWPQPYMDDWRRGLNTSPALEIIAKAAQDPDACARAAEAPNAAEA